MSSALRSSSRWQRFYSIGSLEDILKHRLPTSLRVLRPVDALFISFLLLLSLLVLIFVRNELTWAPIIAINLLVTAALILLSEIVESKKDSRLRVVRDWYGAPLVFIVFKEIYIIIQSRGTRDFDYVFIALDRLMFGVDPTVWLSQFAHPVLTEILQIAYAGYFVILMGVGIELYKKKDAAGAREPFARYVFMIVFGFCISYIGYLMFPGVGPRFTLHRFELLNQELPGIFLTIPIRDLLNAAESIPRNIQHAVVVAQRDVFPSGHTQMALIALLFAFRYNLRSKYWYALLGFLMMVGTVYLRYHYVIDLVGGVIWMIAAAKISPVLYAWWEKEVEVGGRR